MILTFTHNFKKVTAISIDFVELSSYNKSKDIQEVIFDFAKKYPNAQIVWVHESIENQVNYDWIKSNTKKSTLFFFNPSNTEFLSNRVGYVEPSPYIRINKTVQFASWQTSAIVGTISASDFLIYGNSFISNRFSFGYFLTIISKIGNRIGLLTYSNPNLINNNFDYNSIKSNIGSTMELFHWTAKYYGLSKCIQLFIICIFIEKKFPLFELIKMLFVRRINFNIKFENSKIKNENQNTTHLTLDVIIPTIGRKKYLYDFLCDLKLQSKIPNRIIIVEQNPLKNSQSELDYLSTESWPFEIIHHFIHQTGACNARNIALKDVKSDYVFFADDDIRIEANFIKESINSIINSNESAFTLACYKENDKPIYNHFMHWDTFGSGCSIVKKEALKTLTFDKRFENGFGEDADFGMQLRNNGFDVLYLPSPQILHLKAPVGGFRVKPTLPWHNEIIQPKPSPTVMLFKKLHHTKEQLLGYKLNLFLKFYKQQPIKNPLKYYKMMQKQWKISDKWAEILKLQSK